MSINRFPLIINKETNRIQEISSGDKLNFAGNGIFDGTSAGTEGQVLFSTGEGIQWRTLSITNVLWVTKDGDDENNGLSPQTAKATISSALRAANSRLLGKLQDASRLILVNKKLIQEETLGWVQTQYPDTVFNIEKCKRDIGHIVDAVATDLKNGGNINCIDAAASYYVGASLQFINEDLTETIAAFNKARDLMILAMRNWKTGTGTGPLYVPVYSTTPLYVDNAVITTNAGSPVCSSVSDAIATYVGIIVYILQNGVNSVNPQAPSFKTTIFVKSGVYIENNPIELPPNTGIVGDNLREVTISPANSTADSIFYVNNGSYITGVTFSGHTNGQTACSFPKIKIGNTISKSGTGFYGSYKIVVSNATSLVVGMHIFGTGVGTGAVIVSINGTELTVSVANQIDLQAQALSFINYVGHTGVITKSPYIQNCTSMTTTGSGMVVDGDYASGTKSMVLDSYTQYNQGGDGVVITNNGYAQLVSIFEICCDRAVYVSGGATCSITNSNTDFGNYGLIADGVSPLQYIAQIDGTQPIGSSFSTKNLGSNKPYVGQVVTFGNNGNPYYFVISVKILDSGSGYTSIPTITVELPLGPNATKCELIPVVTDGAVTEVRIISAGSQFIETPLITVSSPIGGGTTAILQAVMEPHYYTVVGYDENSSAITFDERVPYTLNNNTDIYFYQLSRVIANSHCFEYVGSGTNISTSIPSRGGVPNTDNEVVQINGGRVAVTSTDHLGNFKVGEQFTINQNTGTITGRSFSKSLFATITPFVLALEG